MNDDATNALNFEDAAPKFQSYVSDEVGSYLSDHELDVADPTCYGEITQEEKCQSHSSQSQSEEQSACIFNVSAIDGKIDSVDQSDVQEMHYLLHRLHHVENVIKFEFER